MLGTALAPGRGRCRVALDDGREVDCEIAGVIATRQRTSLCPGDRVEVQGIRGDRGFLARVLPRRSALSRPGPARAGRRREHVLAANVDRVIVVVSVVDPPPRAGLIDRVLVAATHGGAASAICFNKWDRLPDDPAAASGHPDTDPAEPLARCYESLGIPVFRTRALVPDDPELERMRRALAGETAVFVGPSGVGKSSLLNALGPDVPARTGEIASSTRKGRHTTTLASLYRLPGGVSIIDTPGIREFGLWQIDSAALAAQFSDVSELARECRFRDCRHQKEPDCAVLRAVKAGELSESRLRSFQRLSAELAESRKR